MTQACKEFCDNHSGAMVRLEQLEKRVDKSELDLEKYKSYNEGKMDKFSYDMKELSKDFTSKLETSMKEIKEIMASKETKKDNKVWILVASVIAPALILVFQKLIEMIIK